MIRDNQTKGHDVYRKSALPRETIDTIIEGVNHLHPTRLVVFGSSLSKGHSADDIDLLVVAPEFRGIQFARREELLEVPLEIKLDTWLFTPKEFKHIHPEDSLLRNEVEKYGLDLASLIYD